MEYEVSGSWVEMSPYVGMCHFHTIYSLIFQFNDPYCSCICAEAEILFVVADAKLSD